MRSRNKFILILLLLSFIIPPVQPASANGLPSIVPGTIPSAILKAAVRFRNFNSGEGAEVLLGWEDLRPDDLIELDFDGGRACDGTQPVGSWLPSNHVIFEYYPIPGIVLVTVQASHKYCLEFPTGFLGKLDYIQVDLVNQADGSSVELNNIKFNSIPAGSFSGSGIQSWYFGGQLFTLGFKLEGDLVLSGVQPGGDLNMLQFSLGEVPELEDLEKPVVKSFSLNPNPAILNEPVLVSAVIDDSATGGSNVASAEYSLDGGYSWTVMQAQDGVFDEDIEEVFANFTASTVSLNLVCVRGSDQAGNVSDSVCGKFFVIYRFSGFFRPIQMGIVHSAKAGQTIPFKWMLTDYYGVPVSDRSSFAGLFSYPVNCSSYTGDASLAVEEFGPGQSGLTFTDEYIWHFNWKSRKEYAGTCRAVYVRLLGEQTSPVVIFKFR